MTPFQIFRKAARGGSLSLLITCTVVLTSSQAGAAEAPQGKGKTDATAEADGIARTEQNVQIPQAPVDTQIAARIRRILDVTGWFKKVDVRSREGVVTLRGRVDKAAHSKWAEDLARDTEGVVAVLNDIDVEKARWFDLNPAKQETEGLMRRSMAFLPYLVTSLVILIVFSLLAILNARVGRRVARKRVRNPLLIEIISKLFALPVILIGLYLVLRVCGLTGMAVTVLGGTGAIGLVAGFAMKNILENYFAGVLLSLRNPYTIGDVVDVAGKTGIVRELTTRGTILVDFDGNHIIIPNSTIYQNVITNLSANPTLRLRFSVGIGYQDSVGDARDLIMQTLHESKGVIAKPEPLVVVEEFATGSVLFGVYFWIEPKKANGMIVKSQVMETVKSRLEAKGFTLAREVRQLSFPFGIPVAETKPPEEPKAPEKPSPQDIRPTTEQLLRQANRGRPVDHGDRLM